MTPGHHTAVARLFDAIAQLWHRDSAALGLPMLAKAAAGLDGVAAKPATLPQSSAALPVLRHLDTAVAAAQAGPLRDVAAAIADAVPLCRWRQNPNYVSDPALHEFLARYGYAEFAGRDAFVESSGFLAGVMLLGPRAHYPSHHHPAEEVYHVLAGTAQWQRGDEAWVLRPPGSVIHHRPHVPHATRTMDEPLLVLYCWSGAVGTAARLTAK